MFGWLSGASVEAGSGLGGEKPAVESCHKPAPNSLNPKGLKPCAPYRYGSVYEVAVRLNSDVIHADVVLAQRLKPNGTIVS
jgi:hypothetical protein